MFSLFRKKSAWQAPVMAAPTPASASAAGGTTPEFRDRLKSLLQGSKFLYRDVPLDADALALYSTGTFVREPTLCDATAKFGGPTANTRFLLISAQPRDLSALSERPEWGLCVLGVNQLLKVVDVHREGEFVQVTLLHVPDAFATYFRSADASFFENMITPQTRADFREAVATKPLAEHAAAAWRDRVAVAPGMRRDGTLNVA